MPWRAWPRQSTSSPPTAPAAVPVHRHRGVQRHRRTADAAGVPESQRIGASHRHRQRAALRKHPGRCAAGPVQPVRRQDAHGRALRRSAMEHRRDRFAAARRCHGVVRLPHQPQRQCRHPRHPLLRGARRVPPRQQRCAGVLRPATTTGCPAPAERSAPITTEPAARTAPRAFLPAKQRT